MDADQRYAQAQYGNRQTPRENAPKGWRRKERLPVELDGQEKEMSATGGHYDQPRLRYFRGYLTVMFLR